MKKDVILFGTGSYFNNYMDCYENDSDKRPLFAVDNSPEKVGKVIRQITVKKPEELLNLPKGSYYVVICMADTKDIEKQLTDMGVSDYQKYYKLPMEKRVVLDAYGNVCGNISEEYSDKMMANTKPYKIGYVPGVFDLFHMGHLNLLRNCKERCEYLIAGVLTDELVEYFKGRPTVIPYEQRAAIIESVKYVDRVVPVDFANTYKIDAWHKYHYDCHFSGNDHGPDWEKDRKQLEEVGAKMEFFTYTSCISSTQIKKELGQSLH